MANRLADAPSPYLQQHKDNPVHWWTWCDGAFDEARRRDVPVFLSIGYATCHWCHVMAHESFEDDEVASLLNEGFVCIKVDREERPDIDAAYMAACQAMTGRGGWPLTAVLDHDRRPWFAGTYFPKQSRPGGVGMLDLVPRLRAAWQERREDVLHDAGHLLQHLRRPPATAAPVPDEEALRKATHAVLEGQDPVHGGSIGAPRFPALQTVRFLIRRGAAGDDGARAAALRQLDAMARGGIRDHVGGGFHRYSTDDTWFLPHFEKMLYDQGMALLAYAEAHMLWPSPLYEDVLRTTAEYLLRDLRHGSGAFTSAEDADSEGEEGRFYTWPWDELLDVLGGHEALAKALGAGPDGNHHDEATRRPVPRNHLFAADPGALEGPLLEAWQEARPRLLEARSRRPRPLRDDKIMADWNGLAIAGLAAAGRALRDRDLIRAAEEAFVATASLLGAREADGGWSEEALRHVWIDGRMSKHVFLEDLSGMAFAAAHLAQATHRPLFASLAGGFLRACGPFAVDGAYKRTETDATPVQDAPEGHDGAIPSGNALLAEAALLADRLLFALGPAQAEDILASFADGMRRHPAAYTGLLGVAHDLQAPHADVVVVGSSDWVDAIPAHPHVHALVTDGADDWIPQYRPALPYDEEAAYVCRGDACDAAVRHPDDLAQAVERAIKGSSGAAADAR